MQNYKKLLVWEKSFLLIEHVYRCTENLPRSEEFGLKQQMRRAAVSIPSNIAEGSSRRSKRDFQRFLEISLGSAFELETLIEICRKLNFLSTDEASQLVEQIAGIRKMIYSLSKKLET